MKHLSLDEVIALAPAAAPRRNWETDGLLNTPDVLIDLRFAGFRPVFAMQGTAHSDANVAKERDGRHIVVCASRNNDALAVVNSHTKDRRAFLARGFVDPLSRAFLLGPVRAVQRWRGYRALLDLLLSERMQGDLNVVHARLLDWRPSRSTRVDIAARLARRLYLRGHNTPAAAALLRDSDDSMFAIGMTAVGRVFEGNLTPGKKNQRRIKRVRRPDAMLHAGAGALAALIKFAQDKGQLPAGPAWPPA